MPLAAENIVALACSCNACACEREDTASASEPVAQSYSDSAADSEPRPALAEQSKAATTESYIMDNVRVAEPDESDADSLDFTPGKADRATLMEQSESDSNVEWTEPAKLCFEPSEVIQP